MRGLDFPHTDEEAPTLAQSPKIGVQQAQGMSPCQSRGPISVPAKNTARSKRRKQKVYTESNATHFARLVSRCEPFSVWRPRSAQDMVFVTDTREPRHEATGIPKRYSGIAATGSKSGTVRAASNKIIPQQYTHPIEIRSSLSPQLA